MAALGGIPLAIETLSGGSFKLDQRSSDSWCQKMADGSEVEVKENSEIVVARIPLVDSYDLAYERSLSACQKGLDLMVMTRGLILSVLGTAESHLVWWTGSDGATIRIFGFAPIRMDARPIGVVGGVTPPPPSWDESFRYYRLSQATLDLVEAYRYMFLMLESLLSDIRPQQPREREGQWLLAAFQEAHNRYDLSPFSNVRGGLEADDLRRDFATDARHKISHAKRRRTQALPLDLDLRRDLESKLERLASLCLHLSAAHLGVRRAQNFVFPAFFRHTYSEVFNNLSIVLTSEQRPFDASATELPIDTSLPHVRVTSRRAPECEDPHRLAAFARLDSENFGELESIARLVTTVDGKGPFSSSELEEILDLTGVQHLEVVAGIYMTNVRANRRHYSV